MAAISTWSTTAAGNNSPSPDGYPENMLPSGVDNSCRETMASVRTWYEHSQWTDFGHTPSYVNATSFTIPTDVTAIYETDRRVKCTDATTLYGYISSSSYSSPNTTVNVTLDSGVLSGSLTAVAVAALTATNSSLPNNISEPFDDANTLIYDTGDSTANMRIDCGNITTGNTRVLTMTDADLDLANVALPVADTTAVVKGSTDATKLVRIEADGLTTSTTRVITMPDWDVDLGKGVLQYQYTQTSATDSTSMVIPNDDTIPQNTEGKELFTVAITPKTTSTVLVIEVILNELSVNSGTATFSGALFQDSTANAIASSGYRLLTSSVPYHYSLKYIMVSGTTSETTFKFRYGLNSGAATATVNGTFYGASGNAHISVTEIGV